MFFLLALFLINFNLSLTYCYARKAIAAEAQPLQNSKARQLAQKLTEITELKTIYHGYARPIEAYARLKKGQESCKKDIKCIKAVDLIVSQIMADQSKSIEVAKGKMVKFLIEKYSITQLEWLVTVFSAKLLIDFNLLVNSVQIEDIRGSLIKNAVNVYREREMQLFKKPSSTRTKK